MSSPVTRDDGRLLPVCLQCGHAKSPTPPGGVVSSNGAFNRARLTLPLLCSPGWRRLQVEGPNQVERCRTHLEVVQRRPQVDHAPLLAAARVETVEHVVLEVDAEG